MMVHKVVFLGKSGSGKSQLVKRLAKPEEEFEEGARTSIGTESTTLSTKLQGDFHLWDVAGQERYEPISFSFLTGTKVGVICVNLAEDVDESSIEYIKRKVELLRFHSPKASIILVGTHSDLPAINLENFEILKSLEKFSGFVKTSAKDKTGVEELFSKISDLCMHAENAISGNKTVWAEASERLMVNLNNLPMDKKKLIEEELDQLSLLLHMTPTPEVRAGLIANCTTNCEKILDGKYSKVLNSVLTLAAAALVTVIAASIGFGIGFACGWWTGPGAFFTGLAAGYAAATAVTATSIGLGLIGGGLTAYGLFSPAKEIIAINEFASELTNTHN